MKTFRLFFLALLLTVNLQAADTLTIIHVNDTHSNLAAGGQRDANLKGMLGGIARAASFIGLTKATMPNTLTLHAGDIYVGDLFFQRYYGVAELRLMGALGFDAMTVGNHEFDLTPLTLQTALDTAFAGGQPFPLLSANLILENDTVRALKKYIQPSTIKVIGGLKVGIFGLTTPETNLLSLPAPAIVDTNFVQIAAQTAQALRTAGCDVVVLLSHLGLAFDQIVAEYVQGIDLIVGGHDHYELKNPVVVGGTPIVQAGAFYHSIGLVQLEVKNGKVSLLNSGITPLDAKIPEEPTIAAYVEAMTADIESVYGKVYSEKIAQADNDFHETAENLTAVGNKDTEIGNLITDAYRAFAKTDISVQPGGSTAQMLYKGGLVPADAFRVVGYGFNMNDGLGFRMTTFSVTGAELWQGLEFGLSAIELNDEFVIQVSGMKYTYDPKASAGSRVKSVEIGGKPLNPTSLYSIASNEFVLGFFSIIGINPTNIKILNDATEFAVFSGFLATSQHIIPKTEGRIKAIFTSGIGEDSGAKYQGLSVYPNPAHSQTNITFTLEEAETVHVSVFSSELREVIPAFTATLQKGEQRIAIDTKYLPSGAYIYRVSINGSIKVGQIIVQK